MDDMTLLRQYAAQHSEAAFEILVSRRVRFVYSAALRQVRNPHLAEEITQAVFIILAKKAGTIRDETVLTGWLFKTTRFAAMAQSRAAVRRRQHEQEAQLQSEIQSAATDPLWEQMSPLLDEALAHLGEKDRQAVLLRFFENKSLADVGNSIGAGEDSARMRIGRALEKLRRFFQKRGVVSTTALIAGVISANSVHAAPVGLSGAITATVVKGSGVAAAIPALVKGTLKIMASVKTKTVIAIGVGTVLAGAAVITVQEQEQQNREQEQKIRAEEQQIRSQERQDNLSPEQRQQLEERLNQLRAQQNVLRTKQDGLRAQENQTDGTAVKPIGAGSSGVSPFTKVRYEGDNVMVTYSGVEYELAAINNLSTSEMLGFCRRQYKRLWPKRLAEDLPTVLADMGHPVDASETVSLVLVDPKTGERKTIERASMTAENRQAVHAALVRDGNGEAPN